MEKLLKTRNYLKSRKPVFTRHDSHKKKRVSPNWRRPKGRHNKVRLHRKGYVRHISTGYGSPALVRGLSRNGLKQNVITTKDQLHDIDPKTDGIIISSSLGDRKREELVDEATEKGFTLLNMDAKTFKDRLSEKLKQKASKRKHILKRRASKEKLKESKEKKSRASDATKSEVSSDNKGDAGAGKASDSSSTASSQDKTAISDSAEKKKKEYDKFLTKGDQK
ncbi:MAG: 50S ribosomal protein L32e [Nanoarchaeota archaeon]